MSFFLVDLDGVLVRDKEFNPFEDANYFLNFLRERGIGFKVLSNNSRLPPSELIRRLREKGLEVKEGEVQTPLVVLPNYLKRIGAKRVFVIGTEELKGYLREQGFEVLEDFKVDCVVIGQDKNLDFNKLKRATSAVFLEGAKIVPVNKSRIVKDSDGLYFPGAGSVALLLAHSTNYDKEIPNLGKPSEEFINLALGDYRGEVYLVSDDLYTDLMGAKELGLKTIFMTTGKYPKEELGRSSFKPDYTFSSLRELLRELFQVYGP